MKTLSNSLNEHLLKIIPDPTLQISEKIKTSIKCICGTENIISTRALYRKWNDKTEYLCKKCHVATYILNPQRMEKYIKTREKTKLTGEYARIRQQCSDNAKKLWVDKDYESQRESIKKSVSIQAQTNPLIIAGRKKASKTYMEKYGKTLLIKMKNNQKPKTSIIEEIFKKMLIERSVKYEQQYELGYYKYDFYLNDLNMLIELQGDYWHKDSNEKDSAKATLAVNAGYKIKHLWEHQFYEINKIETILNEICGKQEIIQYDFKFDNVVIKEINNKDVRVFLGQYHYLPSISKYGFHIGAYLNDLLIASATFSQLTRNQIAERLNVKNSQIRELGRFCIHNNYHKKNFASWFLSRAVQLFKNKYLEVKMLISFADTSFHSGTIYKANNWIEDGETERNYMYKSVDNHLLHKKTLWDRASKFNMSENEYAAKHNYIKVWSEPKKRYIFNLGDR